MFFVSKLIPAALLASTFSFAASLPMQRADFNLKDASVAFAKTLLPPNVNGGGVQYQSGYVDDGLQTADLIQTHDGVPIANALASISYSMDGQLVSYKAAFVNPTTFYNSVPNVTPQSFLPQVEASLDATYTESPTNKMGLNYFVKPGSNKAILVYVFQLANADTGAKYQVYVDSVTREVVSVVDLA